MFFRVKVATACTGRVLGNNTCESTVQSCTGPDSVCRDSCGVFTPAQSIIFRGRLDSHEMHV